VYCVNNPKCTPLSKNIGCARNNYTLDYSRSKAGWYLKSRLPIELAAYVIMMCYLIQTVSTLASQLSTKWTGLIIYLVQM